MYVCVFRMLPKQDKKTWRKRTRIIQFPSISRSFLFFFFLFIFNMQFHFYCEIEESFCKNKKISHKCFQFYDDDLLNGQTINTISIYMDGLSGYMSLWKRMRPKNYSEQQKKKWSKSDQIVFRVGSNDGQTGEWEREWECVCVQKRKSI